MHVDHRCAVFNTCSRTALIYQAEKCVADLKTMELSFSVAKLNRFGATLHRELVIKGKERNLVFSDQENKEVVS